jgi:flotillin
VIASMTIDEINRDRDGFLHKVQHQLEPELRKIGLVLLNVNIKDLRDASGYLEALGKQAAQQAIQQARGDVAEQEKLGEIRVAQANREKLTAVAEAEKERDIALRETRREQAVRLALPRRSRAWASRPRRSSATRR